MPFYREDFDREKLLRQNFIHNQCALHPRGIAEEVGGYHEGISFGINWEMWIKLSARYPFKRVPAATVIYRDRATGDTMSSESGRKRQHSRNVTLYTHRIFAMHHQRIKSASRLEKALGSLLGREPQVMEMLDLRELIAGKPYAMLYKLGKYLARLEKPALARLAYLWAVYLAPWEIKSYLGVLMPSGSHKEEA